MTLTDYLTAQPDPVVPLAGKLKQFLGVETADSKMCKETADSKMCKETAVQKCVTKLRMEEGEHKTDLPSFQSCNFSCRAGIGYKE